MSSFMEIVGAVWDWPIISTVFLLLIIYLLIKRDSRVDKYLQEIAGPSEVPLLGTALWFLRPNHELLEIFVSWRKEFGSIMKAWIGNQPFVLLGGGAEAEAILSSSVHIEKSQEYDLLHLWLGQGLLTAKPKKWHGRRKMLTPTFHFTILEEFITVFNEQANSFVKVLKSKEQNRKAFDIFPYVTRCALDIICETAMGKKLDCQNNPDQNMEYIKAVYGYGDMLVKKCTRPWLQIDLIWKLSGNATKEGKYIKTLQSFTEKVIMDKKRERLQKSRHNRIGGDNDILPKKRKAFLDLLLDMADLKENTLSDADIREETDTFMFEGHDTTAANMVFTILTLSSHLEHQKLVQEELDDIFGDDKQRDITSADISRMKYLECCIKETLRIYPSVPFIFRKLNEDLLIGEKLIPKGISVCVAPHLVHRDPSVFPDPEVYNPQRFLPENCIGRNPYAYIPFSAGPRNCIGQKFALLEEKIVLAKLFMNFNFQVVGKREDVKLVPDIILRPGNGVFVNIFPY